MRKLTKSLVLLCMLLSFVLMMPTAYAARVTPAGAGFSFELPDGLTSQPLTDEAKAEGVLFAAQSDDGLLRMIVMAQELHRSTPSTAALVEREGEDESVTVSEPITADGCEFVLTTETVEDAGEQVTFRMATAVTDGTQLTFFFTDRSGAHEAVPAQVVASYQSTQKEAVNP